MPLSRRQLIRTGAVAGAGLAAAPGLVAARGAGAPSGQGGPLPRVRIAPPTTGFERTGTWTTHQDELAFLDEVLAGAPNPITLTEIGRTAEGRPLHLVAIGLGARPTEQPRTMPTSLVVGSQHGNEPAGREAALKLVRDLAFADLADPTNADLARILRDQTVLVVPSANPDGRARGSRANSNGIDINRDHLGLVTEEARALADVILAWEPYVALDLHEYGPSVPVLYDDDLLYLWPRNLNVDVAVQDAARTFCERYIKVDGQAAGYTADEYGLYKVGPNVGPVDAGVNDNRLALQTAGNEDEGICRNAMGLRHVLGILVESRVTVNPAQSPQELVLDGEGGSVYGDSAAARARRVASQRVVLDAMLRHQHEQGFAMRDITLGARTRKAREGAERSAPLFLSGQDDDRPQQTNPVVSVDPPPSGYRLDAGQLADPAVARALSGHGIEVGTGGVVSMGQHAEPVVGLLLDGRGNRSITSAEPLG